MHPNWKALSTVDFQRKLFVRQTENPNDSASTRSAENGDDVSNGDEVRQFYESVLATETEHRTIKKEPDHFFPDPTPRKRSKLNGEKLEEARNLDENTIRQAFIAAQDDDLVTCLSNISFVALVAFLMSF